MASQRLDHPRSVNRRSRKAKLMLGFSLLSVGFLDGCSTLSLLFGTEKPVDEKSQSYRVTDLSRENSEWAKVDPATLDQPAKNLDAPDALSTTVSDVTYISRENASVISLNSSCDPGVPEADLRKSADELSYGMREVTSREELATEVQSSPALQTTVRGKIYGDPMMLRTVVFRRGACQFDLIYLAAPQDFAKNEIAFSTFVSSFRLLAIQSPLSGPPWN